MTEYAPGTSGNAFPKATLSGSSTMLAYPTGIDVDAAGHLYVANQYDDDIHVYPAGAVGDTAPSGTIAGPATALSGPGALAVTPPLSILTRRLPVAHRHRRYHVALRAGEGRTPYHWSIARPRRLPAGLRLTRGGLITGTPRRVGRTVVTFRVLDSERRRARATRRLVLTVRR